MAEDLRQKVLTEFYSSLPNDSRAGEADNPRKILEFKFGGEFNWEYLILCEYTNGKTAGDVTWHLLCDEVVTGCVIGGGYASDVSRTRRRELKFVEVVQNSTGLHHFVG